MTANAGSLGDLQGAFQDYLVLASDAFSGAVRDTRKADRLTLLGVYRDAYFWRLIEVLTTDYPGLMAMCGPADFDHMARAYIAANPSRYRSVRWFGQYLADFLSATAPYKSVPAAAEMACFEWALGEAFDAPDAQPVAAADVMALPAETWGTLAFTPLPSLHRLSLSFEVPQAWQTRNEVEPGDLEVAAAAGPVSWVVWRPDRTTHFRSMEPDEAAMVEVMVEGRTFPEMCEALLPYVGEGRAAARAAGLLRGWVEEGMIATFAY
ncbi:MAG: putative DNA-binding domain-containing protein [Reyranella sp.]|uniref:HvfC/BufC N-terminal domain-containing protein n=1 Tax=Reyranella sp. TaxID=1929291 RepID=UPI001AC8BAEC|nr:DNA-binding domain-containing protein [Reyranella sp.]MBN9086718.1 putative DNA-binding domain-containing protein [Reyranella sp.]